MLTYVRTDEVMPFAAGSAFGNGAGYERLSGIAGGELDPQAAHNNTIVNLERCARNARGLVEYDFDWCVLRPVDTARRSGAVIYDITNRGRKMVLHWLQDAPVNEQPSSLADAGNALLLHRGHSIVWSGWDAAPPERGAAMKIRVPRAIGIEGTVRDEWVPGARMIGDQRLRLSYPCVNTDQSVARLTVRKQQHDAPVDVATADWRYDGMQHIVPTHGHFATGSIYELLYPAREPAVLGIGFAAVRDLGAVLRHGTDHFDAAALDSRCARAPALLGFGISQAGRFLRDLVRGGWNRDE
jgi:Alpha/beta hydrolase domain